MAFAIRALIVTRKSKASLSMMAVDWYGKSRQDHGPRRVNGRRPRCSSRVGWVRCSRIAIVPSDQEHAPRVAELSQKHFIKTSVVRLKSNSGSAPACSKPRNFT